MADAVSIDDLIREIRENPEKLNDESITDEQILAIQQRINPFAYVPKVREPDDVERVVLASYTNLRQDYIRRLTMTGLIGFLFRILDEWEVPPEQRRWVPAKKRKRKKRGAADAGAADDAAGGDGGEEPPPASRPFTAAALADRVERLRATADAAREAAEAAQAAAQAAKEYSESAGRTDDGEKEKFAAADAALAKSRGLLYAATFEARKLGLDADERLDATAAVARQHEEVREIIDRDPVRRAPAGQVEIPARQAKSIITHFLRSWFEYNPDAHVRSAYDEFQIEQSAEEVEIPGIGRVRRDGGDPRRPLLSALRAPPPPAASAEDARALEALREEETAGRAALAALRCEETSWALRHVLDNPDRFRQYLSPIDKDSAARHAIDVIPPADTFFRFNYYMEVQMEELRTATDAIYHEKPDLDQAILVYQYLEGAKGDVDDRVQAFRDKYQDEVVSSISRIPVGNWVLLGDFKQNRKNIDFYNKHTQIIERILERHTEDQKLGSELMRQRVRNAKAKNIRETGPDAQGLADYKASNRSLDMMSGGKVISSEEMARLERARGDVRLAKELELIDQYRKTIRELSEAAKVRELKPEEQRRLEDTEVDLARAMEMIQVPDDAIQVDMWVNEGGKMKKEKFYTKAEAPTHMDSSQRREGNAPPGTRSEAAVRAAAMEKLAAATGAEPSSPAPASASSPAPAGGRPANLGLAPDTPQLAPFAQKYYEEMQKSEAEGKPPPKAITMVEEEK